MFRFTIRDVLWVMVVVGLAITVTAERYRSARLQSELWDSADKLRDREHRFVELALMLQARDPETFKIGQGEFEIRTGQAAWTSWKLSSNEARSVEAYQRRPRLFRYDSPGDTVDRLP